MRIYTCGLHISISLVFIDFQTLVPCKSGNELKEGLVVGDLAAQKGMMDKMLPQLEKSVGAKLEGTVTRQIQTQFQTIGRQALQVRKVHMV